MEFLYQVRNKNNHNAYGGILSDGQKYFFKTMDAASIKRETHGYEIIAQHYPVATLYGPSDIHGESALLFGYIDEIDKPGGMLADILDTSWEGSINFNDIYQMYRKVFKETLKKGASHTHDIFFRDRIHTRIKTFYIEEFIRNWSGKEVVVDGAPVVIQLGQIISELQEFFEADKEELCIVSQADPAEYNIATQPVLLDYFGGGYTPVMAEMATLNALTTFYGDYLARKYNPGFYDQRGLHGINHPAVTRDGSVNRTINPVRIKFMTGYADQVIEPALTASGIDISREDVRAYRAYYAMKMLAIFNISQFPELEVTYILGKLQRIYNDSIGCDNVHDLSQLGLK